MKVQQILQSKGAEVFAVTNTTKISDAVNMLGEKNIGAVIVKDEAGAISGILSERDVVRRLRSEGASVLDSEVGACMTPNPFTCSPDETVDQLMARMTEKRIRHMPVIENGAIVGMVSIGDVVKRKIEQTEQEAAALRDYISS